MLSRLINKLCKVQHHSFKLITTVKGDDNKNKWLPVNSDQQEVKASIRLNSNKD